MQPRRILIVEDNFENGRFFAATLRTTKQIDGKSVYEAEVVDTIKNALDRMDREPDFDLILLDLNLPDGIGEDLVRMLHQHSPLVPIVAITGEATFNAVQMIVAGAHAFLWKPDVGPAKLMDMVEQTLARHKDRSEKAKRVIDGECEQIEGTIQAARSNMACQQAALEGMSVLEQCPVLRSDSKVMDCIFKIRCPIERCPLKAVADTMKPNPQATGVCSNG